MCVARCPLCPRGAGGTGEAEQVVGARGWKHSWRTSSGRMERRCRMRGRAPALTDAHRVPLRPIIVWHAHHHNQPSRLQPASA